MPALGVPAIATTTDVEVPTYTRQVEEWVKRILATNPDMVSLSTITNQALQIWGDDPGFIEWVTTNALRPVVYTLVSKRIAYTRRPLRVLEPTEKKEEVIAKKAQQAKRMLSWYETVRAGLTLNLMQMTKPDLLTAATNREARAGRELQHAAWLRQLASYLEDDQTRLGQVISPDTAVDLYHDTHGNENIAQIIFDTEESE